MRRDAFVVGPARLARFVQPGRHVRAPLLAFSSALLACTTPAPGPVPAPVEPLDAPGAAAARRTSSSRATPPFGALAERTDLAGLRWRAHAEGGLEGLRVETTHGGGWLVDPRAEPAWRATASWARGSTAAAPGLLLELRDGAVHGLDARTGAPRWRHGDALSLLGVAPAGTGPIALVRHVFTEFLTEEATGRALHVQWVHGLDAATGRLRWRARLEGGGQAPALVGATATLAFLRLPDEHGAWPGEDRLAALELATGAVAWQVTLDGCGRLPVLAGEHLVVPCGGALREHDARSGRLERELPLVPPPDRVAELWASGEVIVACSAGGVLSVVEPGATPRVRWQRELGQAGCRLPVGAGEALLVQHGDEVQAYDARDGALVWRYGCPFAFGVVAALDGGAGIALLGPNPRVLGRASRPDPPPTPIAGVVRAGGRPLGGVRIRAGGAVARTDRDGRFAITPQVSGWVVVGVDDDGLARRLRRQGYRQVFLPQATWVHHTERESPLHLEVGVSRAPPPEPDCDCC